MVVSTWAQFVGGSNGGTLKEAFMASAGARAYMGVRGFFPQWGLEAKPLVRGSESPAEAIDIF